MLHTRVNDILGIEYPIIQGGMAWIADAKLASAVSNAGGLGLIAAMNADADWLRKEIRLAKTLTDKPFGVNIMLLSPHAPDVAQVVIDEGVKIVTTGAGSPSPYMDAWLKADIKVVPVTASVTIAKFMEKMGAACVICEGTESGGHIGESTTMTLVPQAADALSIPVIAAGGIADGRGIAAAFMLGAEGVQCGTRFLACTECTVHKVYKEKILKAKDTDTVATGKRLGHPIRCLKTPFSKKFVQLENAEVLEKSKFENMGVGALRLAAKEGDEENGCFMAGQIAGLVSGELSAQQIITEMLSSAKTLLEGAAKWIKK